MAQSAKNIDANSKNADTNMRVISAEKKNSAKKIRKKKGGLIGLVILIVLTVAAAAFLYFSIQYNWGGVRDKLIEVVCSLDPEYVAYTEKITELNTKEAELTELEEKVRTEELKLNQKKTDLDKQEADLKDQVYNRAPIYRRMLNDTDLADMKSLSTIYAKMDPEAAAKILATLYENDDRTAIIYFMSEASAAAILEKMSKDLAAQITDALLRN